MPELPDIAVYVDALRHRIVDRPIVGIRIVNAFFLRSYDPPIESAENEAVLDVRRLGKRIVMSLTSDLHLVVHLMIAGRFRWHTDLSKAPGRTSLASIRFPNGSLGIIESSKKKRASLHLVLGDEALRAHDPGGLDILQADEAAFRAALCRKNRTLKRALTNPCLFSGIGNAYSDELLHAARLSPFQRTRHLDAGQADRLLRAAQDTLQYWMDALRRKFADRFPEPREITAFREGFAVHGKYGRPCPECNARIQRVRFAEREMHYCPGCQTDGRILSDRSLARLFGSDWAGRA